MKKSSSSYSSLIPSKQVCSAPATRLSETRRHVPIKVRSTEVSWQSGMKLMRSERWAADNNKSKQAYRGQPFIGSDGHITGSVYFTWRCSAYQWFATLVRSVIRQISKRTILRKVKRRKTKRNLTEIAIIYCLTMNDSLLERLLCCQTRGFRKLLYRKINEMDDKTRFCYDQALSCAYWFELRGSCGPRVQSIKRTILAKYRDFRGNYDTCRERRELLNWLSDPWIVGANQYHTSGMAFISYQK